MAAIIITALIFFILIQLIPSFIFRRYEELPMQFLFMAYAFIALLQKNSAVAKLSFMQNLATIICISFSAVMVIIYFIQLLGSRDCAKFKYFFLILNALVFIAGITAFCITEKVQFFYSCFSLFTVLFLIFLPFRFFKVWQHEQLEKKILILSTYFMVIMFLGISIFYLFNSPHVQYFFIGVIIYFFGYEFFLCKTAIRSLYNSKAKNTADNDDVNEQAYNFNKSELMILKGFLDNPDIPYKLLQDKIGLSEKTISNYLTSIYRQLKIKNKIQLKKILQNNKELRAAILENSEIDD